MIMSLVLYARNPCPECCHIPEGRRAAGQVTNFHSIFTSEGIRAGRESPSPAAILSSGTANDSGRCMRCTPVHMHTSSAGVPGVPCVQRKVAEKALSRVSPTPHLL